MAATAETLGNPWLLAEQAFPEAREAAEQHLAAFLGGIALAGEAGRYSSEQVNESTLLSAIQLAAMGNESARRVVETNVATDGAERLYKAGHQTRVHLDVVDGKLQQEGRKLTDIHANTLKYTTLIPEMQRRTTHDARNVFLIERLYAEGVLNDYAAVIFSTSSTAMSAKEKKDYNLFVDTETCSIQHFSAEGPGVTLETAFVAGKATPTSERHDMAAIRALAENYGIVIATVDGTEMLQHLMLIPKADLPRGVVDVVRMYDDAAGGTFYGEAKQRQDYVAYVQECEARTQQFDEVVQQVTAQLIKEAHAFTSPLEAILRLDELSERFCVKYAVSHDHVNAAVFGPQAAMHIEEARFFAERGEEDRALDSLRKAQNTANSGSCPLFTGNAQQERDSDKGGSPSQTEAPGKKKWMKCPHCGTKVFDDPCATVLSCWDCSALVVNGKVKSTGNGGSKARRARKEAAEAKRREAELAAQAEAAFEEAGITEEASEEKASKPQAQSNQPALVGATAGV